MKLSFRTKPKVPNNQVRTEIKPNVVVFQTIIFKDEVPIYYEVMQDGIKYVWIPDKKNGLPNLPSFTIWRDKDEWRVLTRNMSLLDKDMLFQAAEDLKGYY
jgi:hypothetical protein